MKQTLMLKFKLDAAKEQKHKLLETIKAYTDAVNFVLEQNLG
ncbi:MAG: transposase, partial [Thermotogae bacterium]